VQLYWIFIVKRRLARQDLMHEHAQGPAVRLVTRADALEHFGRDVVFGAAVGEGF
jgi:hypothetical protein